MQRNASLAVPLGTRNFAAVQTTGNPNLHAQRAATHRAHHRTLHGAAEHHTLLDLLRNAVGYELRIELGLPDLRDVQAHVSDSHAEQLRSLQAQLLDVLTLLADHDTRPCRLDRDVDLLGRALDMNAAHGGLSQARAQKTTHPEIGEDVLRKLLPAGIPLRRPIASDTQPHAQRIDLLTHD